MRQTHSSQISIYLTQVSMEANSIPSDSFLRIINQQCKKCYFVFNLERRNCGEDRDGMGLLSK